MKIQLGAMAPTIAKQAHDQGLTVDGAEQFDKTIDAWNRLRIQGYLTSSQADQVAKKIVKEIGKNAHLTTAST